MGVIYGIIFERNLIILDETLKYFVDKNILITLFIKGNKYVKIIF